mgnify:CR=1 FL=1
MGIKSFIKRRFASYIKGIVDIEVDRKMNKVLSNLPQILDFHQSPKENRQSFYDLTKEPLKHQDALRSIMQSLVKLGIPVEEESINVAEFEEWLKEFPEIVAKYNHLGDVKTEKCLEHFLTYKYLHIATTDSFLDVAAAGSPFVDILNKKNIKSYRLDLAYPKGLNGVNIGGDAGDTLLPDQFISTMALHCAYECFQGDADILFIKEAERILKRKGAVGIIPLYLNSVYTIATSPYCQQSGIKFDSEAKKVWRDDQYQEPFSRHYSPESFNQRIYQKLPTALKGRIIYFNNLSQLMNHYTGQRIYCNFLFIGTKH